MAPKIAGSVEPCLLGNSHEGSEKLIENATKTALEALGNALSLLEELAQKRTQHKQSNSRVVNVAKELSELIKVLTVGVA